MYKEKKINKEKKILFGFAVLLLSFLPVKGADAQGWYGSYRYEPRFYQYGNRSFNQQGYFYNFYYNPYDDGYRWYRDPYYRSIMGGVYNDR